MKNSSLSSSELQAMVAKVLLDRADLKVLDRILDKKGAPALTDDILQGLHGAAKLGLGGENSPLRSRVLGKIEDLLRTREGFKFGMRN